MLVENESVSAEVEEAVWEVVELLLNKYAAQVTDLSTATKMWFSIDTLIKQTVD